MKKIKQGHTLWAATIYRKYTGEGNNFDYAAGVWGLFVFKLKGRKTVVKKSNSSFRSESNKPVYKNCDISELEMDTFKTKAQALKSVEFELSALKYVKDTMV